MISKEVVGFQLNPISTQISFQGQAVSTKCAIVSVLQDLPLDKFLN